MYKYLALRMLQALLGIVFVASLVFALARLTGDPARLLVPENASAEVVASVRENLGLDRPIIEQYVLYLRGIVQLDLGTSYLTREPVTELLGKHLAATASLALVALAFALAVAIPLGILSSIYRGSWVDTAARSLAVSGQAVPAFLLGVVLILVFAVGLQWFPVSRQSGIESYVLPAIAMSWATTAGIVRLTRSSMLEVLDAEHIQMAHAKGLPPRTIYLKHALRNSLIPVLTYTGLVLAAFMNGSIVVENIFAWPGLGNVTLNAVLRRDFPVIQGAVILTATFLILINLLVDVLYAWVDPRIRYV